MRQTERLKGRTKNSTTTISKITVPKDNINVIIAAVIICLIPQKDLCRKKLIAQGIA